LLYGAAAAFPPQATAVSLKNFAAAWAALKGRPGLRGLSRLLSHKVRRGLRRHIESVRGAAVLPEERGEGPFRLLLPPCGRRLWRACGAATRPRGRGEPGPPSGGGLAGSKSIGGLRRCSSTTKCASATLKTGQKAIPGSSLSGDGRRMRSALGSQRLRPYRPCEMFSTSDSSTTTRSGPAPRSDTFRPENIWGRLSLLTNQNLKSLLRLSRT